MQVLTPHQMAEAERQAIRGGAAEAAFMERAGAEVAAAIHSYVERCGLAKRATLLCGKGNNAGDAYVAALHLMKKGYEVEAFQLFKSQEASPLCRRYAERFVACGGLQQQNLRFHPTGVVVDGIFGTGFRGTVPPDVAAVIDAANESGLPILAVDIPSGLNGEEGSVGGAAIRAAETLFLGRPKLGFFLELGWEYVGVLRSLDFGLPHTFTDAMEASMLLLTVEMVRTLLPPVVRTRNKYSRGYVLGVAGSIGMGGAAILSAAAAQRGGAGIVRLAYPAGLDTELAQLPPEVLRLSYHEGDRQGILEQKQRAKALFIGPGLGRREAARQLFTLLWPAIDKPCVLDADALFFLADAPAPQQASWPDNLILTPHHGEMARLLHKVSFPLQLDLAVLAECQRYVDERKITLVLKGAPTFIFHPYAVVRVCPWGDPGMATAGSGDLLTGVVAALLAQGLPPHDAATLGVALHSLAGEAAAAQYTSFCMTASDILKHLPDAIRLVGYVNTLHKYTYAY